MNELDQGLERLSLDDRAWSILDHRWRAGGTSTLQQLGNRFGITRERVRQLEESLLGKFHLVEQQLGPLLDRVETSLSWAEARTSDRTIQPIRSALRRCGVAVPSDKALNRFTAIGRAWGPRIAARWPIFAFLSCWLPPIVPIKSVVQEETAQRARLRAAAESQTNRGLALAVFTEVGHPLHWRDLFDLAERRARRPLSPSGMYMCVSRNPRVFLRVAPGTYGLSKWNIRPSANLTDEVARTLKALGTPASASTILARLGPGRAARASSVRMLLQLHVRFYESIAGSFGLRVWLAPPDDQTLRTPPDFVESRRSLARLERARRHGYNVDRIIAQDREQDVRA